jgi:hypothetical protein
MLERRHAGSLADPIYGKFAGRTNAISRFRENADASDEADFGLSDAIIQRLFWGIYWPWFVSTWLQALVSFGRFC